MSQAVAVVPPEGAIATPVYDRMIASIAECERVDEVKEWRDKALAMAAYARQRQNVSAEAQVVRIRLRAERRIGELLRETERAPAGRPAKEIGPSDRPISPPPLRELGLSKQQSSDFQRMASLPEPVFEEAIAKRGATTASVVRLATPARPTTGFGPGASNAVSAAIKMLLHATADESPNAVLADFTLDSVRNDTVLRAKKAAQWLDQFIRSAP